MFKINEIHKLEKAIVGIYNIDGWDLKWSGGNYEHYDARGYTPKGHECVIEMKFRNDYYEDKLLEKYKYDKLMAMDDHIEKLYFVNDPKANYLFWLNNLKLDRIKTIWCPQTTLWNSKKIQKDCYLISERLALIKNIN
tara:strand:+ start:1534 stop:1947 length:414 start_codon:yes stop_codon:yes gene_type:complete